MRPSTLAIAFGMGRALVGVALLAAPATIARSWVGAAGTPATVLSRSLGARDLVIGAGLAFAAARGGDSRVWLGDDIPRNGRVGTTALAGGSALFGAWLASAID